MTAELAAPTGYGQFFFQLDYDGIKNSPFGFYLGARCAKASLNRVPKNGSWKKSN